MPASDEMESIFLRRVKAAERACRSMDRWRAHRLCTRRRGSLALRLDADCSRPAAWRLRRDRAASEQRHQQDRSDSREENVSHMCFGFSFDSENAGAVSASRCSSRCEPLCERAPAGFATLVHWHLLCEKDPFRHLPPAQAPPAKIEQLGFDDAFICDEASGDLLVAEG